MRIWSDFKPDGKAASLLRAGTSGHEFVFTSAGASAADAEIAFGQPEPTELMAAANLKWVQISSAGYTKFDRADFWQAMRQKNVAVTNSSTVFADACAQHAFAMILAFARGLPPAMTDQLGGGAWRTDVLRKRSFLLNDQHVVIFGYGAIARRLAAMLTPLTRNVTGVRRRPRGDEGIAMTPTAESAGALAQADHVVNILPLSDETEGFFSAQKFAQIKGGAHFYNIGRGRTVDQPALIAALETGALAGAYLDVTEPEPLPPEHPLWKAKNCFITPHSAGGHIGETEHLVGHFVDNLRRFERGEALLDRV